MGVLGWKPSTMALANADAARAEQSLPQAGSQEASLEYQEAVESCQSEDNPVVDLGNQPGVPDGSADLTAEFNKMIWSVDDELGPIDPYEECLAAAGIRYQDVADGAGGWQGLYNYLVGKLPEPPLSDEEPSAEWNSYLRLEAHALEADRDCRAEKYREGLAMLSPMLNDFAAKHAEELTRMAGQWDATVVTAKRQGLELP